MYIPGTRIILQLTVGTPLRGVPGLSAIIIVTLVTHALFSKVFPTLPALADIPPFHIVQITERIEKSL